MLEQAKQKRFLAGLKKLADALVAPMRIDLADLPGDWMEMPEHDLGDILQHPDFDLAKENTSHKQESNATDPVLLDILGIWRRIRKAVTLLPNATALFIFAGIFVALELVVTRMLVNQIWGPERGLMFLLIGLGVWILVWGFLAWRVPAAAVEKEVRRMEKLLNDVATGSETEFSTNADKLRDHWLRVGYRLAEWLQRRRGQRLNNNLQFLDAVRGGYEKDYPWRHTTQPSCMLCKPAGLSACWMLRRTGSRHCANCTWNPREGWEAWLRKPLCPPSGWISVRSCWWI